MAEITKVFSHSVDGQGMVAEMLKEYRRVQASLSEQQQKLNTIKDYLKTAGAAFLIDDVDKVRLAAESGEEALVFKQVNVSYDNALVKEAWHTLGGSDRAACIVQEVRYKPAPDFRGILGRLRETEARKEALALLEKSEKKSEIYKIK